ncbi:MAG: response regulator, partial [Phycisphaerae bacterium]
HMTSWGLTCSTASSGAEAIERATSQPFDLIVIDWRMPGMTGLEATRKLRTLGVDIPIIALTAHAMAGAREACLDAGCDGYLPKPINFPQLRDIVSDLLGPQDGNVSESLSDESESILNDNSLAPITVRYLTTLAIECKQLRDAADEANWTLIRDIAHRIHGTAGSFTLRVISDLAEQLRRSCDVQSREQAMDIIVAMQQASESALMKISPE